LKALGAFLLVMACLLIFLRLLGRLNRGRLIKDGLTFTLKGTLPLDSRRYIAAVEVDGRLLILGVAPERITSLAHWSVDDAEAAKTGLSFGELGLEDSQGDFGLEHGMDNAASPGGTPQTTLKKGRETLKEPAFYRGKTEEEERTMMEPGRDSLGLDESGFSGPETNDDFQRANPDKEGDK
jgi:hypothetical protein